MNDNEFFSRLHGLEELDGDRIRAARAMVVGTGNIGAVVALEVARLGFGSVVLIDRDDVEIANTSRALFQRADVGKPKAIAAAARISELVPGVAVTALVADVRTDVPEHVFSSCDAVFIATDSWSSRMFVNRWAHALPGRTKIVITGAMHGLSWEMTSSVPGSGAGCSQCPFTPEIALQDEEGGCGIVVRPGARGPEPSASFVGAAVGTHMVFEAAVTLGGKGPRYAGKMLWFDAATGHHSVISIEPNPDCDGHRRLAPGEDYVCARSDDVTPQALATDVAAMLDALPDEIVFTTDRDVVRTRHCRGCGLQEEIHVSVLKYRGDVGCSNCQETGFAFDVGTQLIHPDVPLSRQGVPVGKAVRAHAGERSILVIRNGGTT